MNNYSNTYNQGADEFLTKPLIITGEVRPRIDDGTYEAKFIHHKTSNFKQSPKVEFVFEITKGIYLGNQLGLFLTVKEAAGPMGLNGAFIPKGHHSNLAKLLKASALMVNKGHASIADLRLITWSIVVSETTHGWDKSPLPEGSRYSKIVSATPKQSISDF